ncbi:MAG TPA: rod shape-determining protein MreD [Bacillales bacterium]|nr:rod shape-determining protein MreD [Bacillales bacterium]
MIRIGLPVVTFFFFLFEGTVMQVFSPEWFGVSLELVPRFVMVIILFIAFFLNRQTALVYGLVFGFLTDVVYSDVLGVYFFSMAFTAYLVASFAGLFHTNLFTMMFLGLLGVVLLEFQVYGMYWFTGIAQRSMDDFLNGRLWPTLVLNGVFIILMYYPLKRLFAAFENARRQEN